MVISPAIQLSPLTIVIINVQQYIKISLILLSQTNCTYIRTNRTASDISSLRKRESIVISWKKISTDQDHSYITRSLSADGRNKLQPHDADIGLHEWITVDSALATDGEENSNFQRIASNPKRARLASPLAMKLKFRLHCARRRERKRNARPQLRREQPPCARLLVARNTRQKRFGDRECSDGLKSRLAVRFAQRRASRRRRRRRRLFARRRRRCASRSTRYARVNGNVDA